MATSTLALILAAAAAGLLGAVVWYLARRRWETTGVVTVHAADAVRVGWVAVGVGMVQVAVVVGVVGGDMWDVMSVVYLDLVVTVPLVGAGVLVAAAVAHRRGRGPAATRPALVLAALALVPAAVGYYATHLEPYRLRTDRVDVELASRRRGEDPLVVGVLSDIQTVAVTGHERAAVDRLLEAEPDLILVAGDLFQGTAAQYTSQREALWALLAPLEAPGGAWFVPGDVDSAGVLEELVTGTPVRVLTDEVVTVDVGDRRVQIGGVSLEPSPGGLEVVRRLESDPGAQVRILLAHRPDWALHLEPDSRVDLVVAGHTHGGQVQLPGLGPLMTLSDVPRDVAAGGLHDLDGNRIYVSTGVGREQQGAPSIRFGVRPSVGVLTLRDGAVVRD